MDIKENTVYNCDCLELMRSMVERGIVADWLITDPPYGIKVNHNMGRRKGDKSSNYSKAYWDNERISKEYFDLMLKCSKNQIIFGGNYYADHLPPSSCWVVWDKLISDEMSFAQVELAWTNQECSSKKVECFPNGGAKNEYTQPKSHLKLLNFA